MSVETLTSELSTVFALPEPELIRKGLLALVEKEMRFAFSPGYTLRSRSIFDCQRTTTSLSGVFQSTSKRQAALLQKHCNLAATG